MPFEISSWPLHSPEKASWWQANWLLVVGVKQMALKADLFSAANSPRQAISLKRFLCAIIVTVWNNKQERKVTKFQTHDAENPSRDDVGFLSENFTRRENTEDEGSSMDPALSCPRSWFVRSKEFEIAPWYWGIVADIWIFRSPTSNWIFSEQ